MLRHRPVFRSGSNLFSLFSSPRDLYQLYLSMLSVTILTTPAASIQCFCQLSVLFVFIVYFFFVCVSRISVTFQ